jgi:acyl-CoA synthetase (NDP forming)
VTERAGTTWGTPARPAAERLEALFNPRSVALVGATDRSHWSLYTFDNLIRCSPGVRVWCVHPFHSTVHGVPAVRRLADLPEPADLAYIMVPTERVPEVLQEAADCGIRQAVVLTAGFSDAGVEGHRRERQLVELALERDLLLLGPNGNGFVNLSQASTPFGLPIPPALRPGPVGIVLQSGGLAGSVLALAQAWDVGLSLVVATGNEAMVSAADVLDYLVGHRPTRAVAMFLESIRDGDRFRRAALAALEVGKPVVVFKVGRSEAGRAAALAHTGAVAGDARATRAALLQLGAVCVDSLEDLIASAGLLGYESRPLGRRGAVITASGGSCEIIADRAAEAGLELPPFPPETDHRLRRLLPAFANPRNPLDVTGYVVVDPDLWHQALEVVAEGAEGTYDFILFQTTLPSRPPPDPTPVLRRYDAVAEVRRRSRVPVLIQTTVPIDVADFGRELLARHDLAVLPGMEHGMTALVSAIDYHRRRQRSLNRPPSDPAPPIVPPDDARGAWSELRARQLLAAHGVEVVPAELATSVEGAVAAARRLGWPVVLKAAAPGLLHKADVGGVRLGLRDEGEVADAYRGIVERVPPIPELDGVLVSPARSGGVELLVGVRSDEVWGQILSVGLGGVFVEVLDDVALRVLPVDREEILAMLTELRASPLLDGVRGTEPVDRHRLAAAIEAIARLAHGLGPALIALEVNPLWASGSRVEALDALVLWAR